MTHPARIRQAEDLGRATEARLAAAFGAGPLLTHSDAAKLLALDEKTLRALADGGVLRFVLIGEKTRRYTEADIRAFLAGERPEPKEKPCPSTSRRNRGSGSTTSSTKVIGFTEALARRRAEKPKS